MAPVNCVVSRKVVEIVLRGWVVGAVGAAIFTTIFIIGAILSGHGVFLAGLVAPLSVIGLSMLVLAVLAVLVDLGVGIVRQATPR